MSLFDFLHRSDPAPTPEPRKRQPRRSLKETDWLPTEAVRALLAAAEGNPRAYAMLAVLVGCGLRCNELRMLDLEDYQPATESRGATIQIRFAKGGKERTVPVPPMTQNALEYWFDFRGTCAVGSVEADCPALFRGRQGRLANRTIREFVKDHGRAAGLGETVHPHMLRHTYATHLTLNGEAIEVVQVLCGHVSIATTQLYVAVPDSRRFAAVAKLDFAA